MSTACPACQGTGFEPEREVLFTLELPLRTVTESNAEGMWRTKARRAKQHRTVTRLALRRFVPPAPPLVFAFVRIAPGQLDDDNLPSALKHCRDGVQDWLGIDDADPRLTWTYAQERGAPGQYGIRLVASRPATALGEPGAANGAAEARKAAKGGSRARATSRATGSGAP